MTDVRIAPLKDDELNPIQHELIAPYARSGRIDNVFRTMVRHPDLMRRWLPLVNHVLFKSSLSAREREILILRTGWLCRSRYEWAQHIVAARRLGFSDLDIEAIAAGAGLSSAEDILLRAADQLHSASGIDQQVWELLSRYYEQQQLMDIVFTVGQYTLVAMALNSFGVELDPYLAEAAPGCPESAIPARIG
jgi:alkylhydroperoxidase family enzyme